MFFLLFNSCLIQEILRAKRRAQDDVPGELLIAYNSVILNTVYENVLKSGVSLEIIAEFVRVSPIAWVHIAFTGRYNFTKSNGVIDVIALAKELEKHLKQHF